MIDAAALSGGGGVAPVRGSGEIEPWGTIDPWFTGKKNTGVIGNTFKIRVDVSNAAGSVFDEFTVTELSSADLCERALRGAWLAQGARLR